MTLETITDELIENLAAFHFSPPVTHVYNPLLYARKSHDCYTARFGQPPKEVLLVGMNPGPWGMAQTGIPFGNVESVTTWLDIREPVGKPEDIHPKRPIQGFDCPRSEVSGKRIWGWAKEVFGTPERFFKRFYIANYCPLSFMEESGRNRTPDKLPVKERTPLIDACDRALLQTIEYLSPRYVIGVGVFAATRINRLCRGSGRVTGRITHPSPANPLANQGWTQRVRLELEALGINL